MLNIYLLLVVYVFLYVSVCLAVFVFRGLGSTSVFGALLAFVGCCVVVFPFVPVFLADRPTAVYAQRPVLIVVTG